MERVQCKKSCNQRAPPGRARNAAQRNKQQHGIRSVKEKVYQVWSKRPGAEELHIEHVRKPRERVPIAGIKAAESPDDVGPREPGQHMGVFEHVLAVIVDNKAVMRDRPINHECENTEQSANQECPPFIVLKLTQG